LSAHVARSLLQVRIHRISPPAHLGGSIRSAIEEYLSIELGAKPTERQIKTGQAVYSQRTRAQKKTT
jgi:hypothetical protein